MGVKNAAVIEIDELVLSAAPHGDDTDAGKRAPLASRQPATERGMMEGDGRDATANEMAAQLNDGAFDFGKLGHVR